MKKACFIYPPSYHYRAPFHERLRSILKEHGVEYTVFYSDLGARNRFKNDTVDIEWGKKVPLTRIASCEYQHALKESQKFDLIIIQQENKLLVNYIIYVLSRLTRKKIAYFGHGRNFQSRNPAGKGERFKRFWATKVDWWFGYTDETRSHIESLGFPSERITVFNNAVDTSEVRRMVDAVTPTRLDALRRELGLVGKHVGVFVGGIYPDKRVTFLVTAADRIRERIPDFEMLVIGGGSDLPVIMDLAKSRPWIHVLGPRFGTEKIELMMLGHLFLMPGLVGLAILDAGTAGLPMATTRFPWHSPEIAYIEPEVNGIVVDDWRNPDAYADAVCNVLANPARLAAMRDEAIKLGECYTIEAMATRFAAGVLKALEL